MLHDFLECSVQYIRQSPFGCSQIRPCNSQLLYDICNFINRIHSTFQMENKYFFDKIDDFPYAFPMCLLIEIAHHFFWTSMSFIAE